MSSWWYAWYGKGLYEESLASMLGWYESKYQPEEYPEPWIHELSARSWLISGAGGNFQIVLLKFDGDPNVEG